MVGVGDKGSEVAKSWHVPGTERNFAGTEGCARNGERAPSWHQGLECQGGELALPRPALQGRVSGGGSRVNGANAIFLELGRGECWARLGSRYS